MNIDGVSTGIVIDHIRAGKSMEVYRLLNLSELSCSVAIIQNAKSTKYGKKDIIKIDEMIDLDLDILGYIDSNITVNFVIDGKLEKKEHLEPPATLVDVIKCKNPRCISVGEEGVRQKFYLADHKTKTYRCKYCDVEYSD